MPITGTMDDLPANFFDLTAADAKGATLPMSTFAGTACLCVNVASN